MTPLSSTRLAALRQHVQQLTERMSPRQRQYLMLLGLLAAGIGMLWLVFASGEATKPAGSPRRAAEAPSITHIGVMSPGQQVHAVDQWVGTAGTRLAQYEADRESQARLNADRQAFESRTMQRFAELEQRLLGGAAGAAASAVQSAADSMGAAASAAPATGRPAPATRAPGPAAQPGLQPPQGPPPGAPTPALPPPAPVPPFPSTMPPASALPVSPFASPVPAGGSPAGPLAASRLPPGPALPRWPGAAGPGLDMPLAAAAPPPVLNRVRLAAAGSAGSDGSSAPGSTQATGQAPPVRTLSTFLPVSFTRGTLLGGLDAPTGGQAQSNPHPVLIRLADNAILPNRFRGDYRDCFVIAAGYGDISAERAYLRTESLSCVRADGGVLEVRIQGSVYGEDGKVGMRGRLVTKQGQMLANALLAGVVSGIGQGIASASTQVSSSPLGTITSASGSDALKAGLGGGVGRALDRLAQYYIKLAENTFPVIEIDAGREIDVVVTRGVRIDTPMVADAGATKLAATGPNAPAPLLPGPSMQARRPADEGGADAQD